MCDVLCVHLSAFPCASLGGACSACRSTVACARAAVVPCKHIVGTAGLPSPQAGKWSRPAFQNQAQADKGSGSTRARACPSVARRALAARGVQLGPNWHGSYGLPLACPPNENAKNPTGPILGKSLTRVLMSEACRCRRDTVTVWGGMESMAD